nr:hypothetical protein [Tanacetum cinerariifolium]
MKVGFGGGSGSVLSRLPYGSGGGVGCVVVVPAVERQRSGVGGSVDSSFELTGFSDADYARCKDTFKSTSGGAQFLGEKLAQVLWTRTQLSDYGYDFDKIPIYCDSKSAIAISCNPVQHSRTKHIAVRYHFIKEHIEKGTIELQNQRDLSKDTPIDRLEVLRYDTGKRSKVRTGIMPTETELTLKQTQQGAL